MGRLSIVSTATPPQHLSAEPVVEIRELSVELQLRARAIQAVRGVSLAIGRGETVGLVGESGSGKTMLSLAVMRLLPRPFGRITGGEVHFDGRDLTRASEAEMRRIRGNRISMIFQEPMTSLDPVFTVGSQIVESIRAHRQVDRSQARELALTMLERVQIPSPAERFDNYPHELSGGMRQRVMIAMALCLQPELLLADEPTTALDVTVQAQILELIAGLQAELKMGVLLVTHNLAVLGEIADRVAVMYAGEIVELARREELLDDPKHPYTQGLLRSIPKMEARRERLYAIPGRPPDLTTRTAGCPFEPRCPNAIPRCATEHPTLEQVSGNAKHSFRCWNPKPIDEQ